MPFLKQKSYADYAILIGCIFITAEGFLPKLPLVVSVETTQTKETHKIFTKYEKLMELKIIELNVDKSKEIYASANCQQLINSMNEYYPKIGFNKPWVGYFALENNQIVGTGGFTGLPKDGKVEIAYWTFKEFEGQGIASFVCKQLIKIAKTTDPIIIITAKTAPEHNASTKILQNNGFTFTEIVKDDEIGDAWLWTMDK